MGFKLGVIAGAVAGYVLGTKAGRERYEQIRRASATVMASQTARSLEQGARDVWDTAQQEFPGAAAVGRVVDEGRQSPR